MSLMCILLLNAMASRLSVIGPSRIRTPTISQEIHQICQKDLNLVMKWICGELNLLSDYHPLTSCLLAKLIIKHGKERTKTYLVRLFGNKAIKLFCSVLLTSYKRLLFIYYLDKTEKLSSKAECFFQTKVILTQTFELFVNRLINWKIVVSIHIT